MSTTQAELAGCRLANSHYFSYEEFSSFFLFLDQDFEGPHHIANAGSVRLEITSARDVSREIVPPLIQAW